MELTPDGIKNLIKQVVSKAKLHPEPVSFEDEEFGKLLTSVPLSEAAKYRVVVLSPRAWIYFIGSSPFFATDSFSKRDEALHGRICTALGAEFLTDAYFHPTEQITASDTFYIASTDGSVVVEAISCAVTA